MTYGSILTYIDNATSPELCLDAAIGVTRKMNAHLSVLAFGYEPNVPSYAFGDPGVGVTAELYAMARSDVGRNMEMANAALQQSGILGDAIPTLCLTGTMAREIGGHAQYADLVVLPQPYGDDVSGSAAEAFVGALFDGDATVLVCPAGTEQIASDIAMIAWNGSREALSATRRAIPFLKQAKTVEVVLVDTLTDQPDPGERLALMLSRHGIKVDIITQPQSPEPVSETLLRRARELQAGLLVMGAYGHSRLREYLVGGVTRDLLSRARIPVLLAH